MPPQPLSLPGQETGIDLGLESFATLAAGSQIANPRIVRGAELPLKRAQRRGARRGQGRRRRRKAGRLLAKAHQQVRRTRQDCQPQTALALVRHYDTLDHAALQPANRVQNPPLATSIRDVGWRGGLSILACKAADAGKRVVAVLPAFTSPACSGGGVLVEQALSIRWHACPECGTSLHRDHNAALTILRLGPERAAGQAVQAFTWAAGPSVA